VQRCHGGWAKEARNSARSPMPLSAWHETRLRQTDSASVHKDNSSCDIEYPRAIGVIPVMRDAEMGSRVCELS